MPQLRIWNEGLHEILLKFIPESVSQLSRVAVQVRSYNLHVQIVIILRIFFNISHNSQTLSGLK
jgi:hypothetical protein